MCKNNATGDMHWRKLTYKPVADRKIILKWQTLFSHVKHIPHRSQRPLCMQLNWRYWECWELCLPSRDRSIYSVKSIYRTTKVYKVGISFTWPFVEGIFVPFLLSFKEVTLFMLGICVTIAFFVNVFWQTESQCLCLSYCLLLGYFAVKS